MPSLETLDLSREPLATSQLTVEQKTRLADVLDLYLSSLENGVPIDSGTMLDEHPDLASHLRAYLDSLDELHCAAAGFANSGGTNAEVLNQHDGDARRLGDFVLERELGRGGMGIVYEARQISLDRKVALKVLPFASVLDSSQIARFKSEAQAAAQILHPNIVPVFAVGVDRGVHFYAMRLIGGQPLDRAIAELRESRSDDEVHADRESDPPPERSGNETHCLRADPTRESLLKSCRNNSREYPQTVARLGLQAAEALHAAHEHGIVHRDVKPSNLLLDHEGKLWVTDFGLARCQRDAGFSKTGDVVGTMRYMSPEQASGKKALIDHRTDVYALGVTLYELLTLEPAVQGDDGPQLLRNIADEVTPAPRKLQPQIPVALQNVVVKAMAKARDDRYVTAKDLADDLRRFLDGKPTVAKPPTIAERLTKWGLRHKGLVAATVSIALLACIGFAVSTLLIAREKVSTQRNFERAERNFRDAQEAVDRFGAQYAERLASVPGAAGVRREMLLDTLVYYQRFVQQAGNDPSLQADLALTHSKIGNLSDEIGSTGEAIAAHEKALAIFKQLSAAEPHVSEHRRRHALCQNNLAMTLQRAGRMDDAKRAYIETIRRQQRLVRETQDEQSLGDLAVSQTNLGLLLSETGKKKEAERSFRDAIRLQKQLVGSSPNDADRHRNIAATLNNLSTIYSDSQPDEAIACCESALGHQRIAAASQPNNASYKSQLAATYNNLGSLQSQQGEFATAAASYEQAIQLQRELLKPDPSHRSYRQNLAVSYSNYGLVLGRLRRTPDAQHAFQQSLAIQETLVALNPDDIALRSCFGSVYNNLGIVLEEQGSFDKAVKAYEDAVGQQRIALLRAPSVARYRDFLSKHYFNLGRVLRRLGRPDRAARIALARRELWLDDGKRLYSVAQELAFACRDLPYSPGSGKLTAEQTASLAIDTLERAAKSGFHLPNDLAANKIFAPLRDNYRFAKLVRD